MGNNRKKKTNVLSALIIAATLLVIAGLAVFLIRYLKDEGNSNPGRVTVADEKEQPAQETDEATETDINTTEETAEETTAETGTEETPETGKETETAETPEEPAEPEPEPSQADLILADVFIEQPEKIALGYAGVGHRVEQSVRLFLRGGLHRFCELKRGLPRPHCADVSVHFTVLLHEPVEQPDALGIDIRSHY